jgi:autotransporter-associated beta strand protein
VGANGTVVLGGDQTLGTLAGDGALALGTHTLSTGLSGDSSFAGVISGSSGGLVKQGAGSFTLAGNNSYGGSTRLAAGTLVLAADNVLPNGSAVQVDSGTTLALGGSDTVSTLVLDGTLAGAGTLTASSYTLHSGAVAAGAALGAGALSSSGASALAGTAAATTVGVADGTLLLDGVNRLTGNPDITVASGATLQLTGAESASTLGLSGTLTGSGHTLTATTTTLNTGAVVGRQPRWRHAAGGGQRHAHRHGRVRHRQRGRR